MDNLFAERVKQMENGELGDLMRLIGQDDIISFAGGIPSPDIFPVSELNEIAGKLLSGQGKMMYQYSSTEGSDLLKEYLVEYLGEREINTSPDELIITAGSQQALDLVSKIFIDPGDKVIVEKPGYVGGIGAIKSYEADIVSITMESDGIDTEELEEQLNEIAGKGGRVKFVYLVPDFSNPSGARLGRKKRRRVLELASEFNFYILEDTPYSELNYYDDRFDYIKQYDREERVIFLGSFSKFFVPGLRVGWVCAPEEMIDFLSRAKQNTDLATGTFGQLLLYQAGCEGLIDKQAEKVKPFYRERLETMASALEEYFPSGTDWYDSRGGFFFWVKLPEGVDSRKLLNRAIESKVAFVTGSSFFADPEDGKRYMRLSFSDVRPQDIKDGIRILGGLISEMANA
ncbi:MAG: PLP-dependent aminotransferase family protein [Halanaerobiaceae bacterium]